MTAGELFVNIVLKGSEKAVKDLEGIKKGLGDTKETALATKVALLAMLYGLERMTGWAAQAGLDLNRFTTLTGQSTDKLQRWQLAARMAGSSAEEMTQAVTGISDMIQQMKMGGGAPAELGILARTVGFDPKRMDDAFYILEQAQKFAKTQPAALSKQVLGALGINPNTMYVLKQTTSDISKLHAQVLSKGQINQLEAVNRSWARFWYNLESVGKTMVAGSGNQVVGELNHALSGIIRFGQFIDKIAKSIGGLKTVVAVLGGVILAAFSPVSAVVAALMLLFAEVDKFMKGKDGLISGLVSIGKSIGNVFVNPNGIAGGGAAAAPSMSPIDMISDFIKPSTSAATTGTQAKGNSNYTANVNIYGGGDDPQEVGKQSQKGVMSAFQTIPGSNH